MYNAYLCRGNIAITPSDTVEIQVPSVCTSLYIGGSGDVTLFTEDGTTATYKAVPQGSTLWIRYRRVMATGTTATLLVGQY